MPGNLAGHRLTRPGGTVQCESMLVIDTPPSMYTRWPNQGREPKEQAPNLGKLSLVKL